MALASLGTWYALRGRRFAWYYVARWKSSRRLKPAEVMGPGRPAADYYYVRPEDEQIRQHLRSRESVLVIGSPLGGKSRAVYEALKRIRPARGVLAVACRDIDPETWLWPRRLAFWRRRIVVIDDLHRFVEMQNYERVFQECLKRKIPVVATCRAEFELEKARESMGRRGLSVDGLFGSNVVALGGVSEERAREIAGRTGVDWNTVRFNGCVGSVFMKLEEMERRFNALDREPRTILQAMRTLYQCGIYRGRQEFPEEWVKIAVDKAGLEPKKADWNDWLEDLQSKEFIRCGEASVWAEEVYLEDIVRPPREVSLLTTMREMADAFDGEPEALVKLGTRANEAGSIRLETADYQKLAIKAYKEALKSYSRQKSSPDYAMTQNNLGTAYRTLAEVEDRAENCRKAIAACGEALSVLTEDLMPWPHEVVRRNLERLLELCGIGTADEHADMG